MTALLLGCAVWVMWGGRRGIARLKWFGPRALPAWAEGRPDALPLGQRAQWGTAGGFLVWLVVGGWLGWWLAPMVAVALTIGLGHFVSGRVQRRHEEMVADFPLAAELLAACLSTGLPLRAATKQVGTAISGPLGELLEHIYRRVTLGEPEVQTWMAYSEHPVIGEMCRDLSLAVDSGLALTSTVQRHAQRARMTARNLAERRAKQVGVQTVFPMMMCYLPAFILLGIVPIIGGIFS